MEPSPRVISPVFPVIGDDQYITIACETDAQWSGLCDLIPALDRSLTADQRLDCQNDLDIMIARFTSDQDGRQLEAALQDRSIPAALVQNSPELVTDPQLLHRGHFVEFPTTREDIPSSRAAG